MNNMTLLRSRNMFFLERRIVYNLATGTDLKIINCLSVYVLYSSIQLLMTHTYDSKVAQSQANQRKKSGVQFKYSHYDFSQTLKLHPHQLRLQRSAPVKGANYPPTKRACENQSVVLLVRSRPRYHLRMRIDRRIKTLLHQLPLDSLIIGMLR